MAKRLDRAALRRKIIDHTIIAASTADELVGRLNRALAGTYRAELAGTYPAGRFCRGCGCRSALGHRAGCEIAAKV